MNLVNPLGFKDLEPGLTPEQQEIFDAQTKAHFELCKAFQATFSTETGKRVLKHLREMTIENAAWCASMGMENGVAHGFAREGQNSIVRYMEERIAEALRLGEQKNERLKQSKGKTK